MSVLTLCKYTKNVEGPEVIRKCMNSTRLAEVSKRILPYIELDNRSWNGCEVEGQSSIQRAFLQICEEDVMKHLKKYLLFFVVCVVPLSPISAWSVTATTVTSSDQVQSVSQNQAHIYPVGECWKRIGPFVTQSTAWQRWRQAESQGYGVSGVFPCHGQYGRGYCFNIFFPC